MRGAPPRTPVKDLLGKVLDNPQNLLIGGRDGFFLRMGVCGKENVCAGKAFSITSDRLIQSGRPVVAPTTHMTNRPLKQAHL